ncbi:MAG: energy transducer TonB [Candidatus Aminicenantes bacterium]|nr:energy transducer TonB [Candidatus Aminicenantes bacterium]
MKKAFLFFVLWWALAAAFVLSVEDAAKDDSGESPKIVKKVNPVYPEKAAKLGIEGMVRIEATTNEKGDVVSARIVPSENPQPLLEKAALAAVRQWKYEPFMVNGKAKGVTFTVTMNFALKRDKKAALALTAAAERPKILKKVNPVYPEEALQKRIEGMVRIEATTDEKGDVVSARIVPSESPQPLLEEAALAALRQWKYEPFMVDGKAKEVTFTVTMNFALDKGQKQEK